MNISKFQAILFDLDGTLLDTALDLGLATNYVLAKYGQGPISDDTARDYASDGMRALMKSGIPKEKWSEYDFDAMRNDFLPYYHEHIADRTNYFKDMDKFISSLQSLNIPIAVVTSKPDHLAKKVLKKFKELSLIDVVIGCDTLPVSKPDPAPLIYACDKLGVNPAKCIYIGDHIRDIEAGHNANMPTVLAAWGYIKKGTDLKSFNADYIANDVYDLANIIGISINN